MNLNRRNRHRNQEVFAFIDSQNLNVSTQKLGWKVDWRKFRSFLAESYGVTKAYMFIGYMPEHEDMYEQLHESGYAVVLKPTFDMTKPRVELENEGQQEKEDEKPVKGNIDADLVLWAMKELANYDKAVIVSGDGDFYSLVEYLEQQGKLRKLLAPNAHYSNLYNRYENYVDRLDQQRKQLAYHDFKKRPKPQR
jgi:uncharacterized LabA/DUF88 family protein